VIGVAEAEAEAPTEAIGMGKELDAHEIHTAAG
jgi:hypothetical protein